MSNIILKRKEVISLSEVNREYSKYKQINIKSTNFFEVTSELKLRELSLFELESAYRSGKAKKHQLVFKQVENEVIVKELSALLEKISTFQIVGVLEQAVSDDIGDTWQQSVLKIETVDGKLVCTIL